MISSMMGSSANPLSSKPQMDGPHTALLCNSLPWTGLGHLSKAETFVYFQQQEDV